MKVTFGRRIDTPFVSCRVFLNILYRKEKWKSKTTRITHSAVIWSCVAQL